MQQPGGWRSALDPEVSESLSVISYFDALMADGVGLDGLLRGAAVLAGVVAGAEVRGKVVRRDPQGRRVDDGAENPRSATRQTPAGTVWLERTEAAHAGDALILERLALAVELAAVRHNPDNALDILLDEARTTHERASSLARLGFEPDTRLRVIASTVEDRRPNRASTIVATHSGMLRATVDVHGDYAPRGRTGFGTWERAFDASASWEAAAIAFRFTDMSTLTVDASELGALLPLVRKYDPRAPHADVLVLDRLDTRSAQILRTLVEAESVRAAAVQLGMHHSSLQARHEDLTLALGYDPRTVVGRIRYATAEMLRRLTDPAVLRSSDGAH